MLAVNYSTSEDVIFFINQTSCTNEKDQKVFNSNDSTKNFAKVVNAIWIFLVDLFGVVGHSCRNCGLSQVVFINF